VIKQLYIVLGTATFLIIVAHTGEVFWDAHPTFTHVVGGMSAMIMPLWACILFCKNPQISTFKTSIVIILLVFPSLYIAFGTQSLDAYAKTMTVLFYCFLVIQVVPRSKQESG